MEKEGMFKEIDLALSDVKGIELQRDGLIAERDSLLLLHETTFKECAQLESEVKELENALKNPNLLDREVQEKPVSTHEATK